MKLLTYVFSLVATTAAAQVQVVARLEKPSYLAGEPIAVLLEIRNVGKEPVAYDRGLGDVRLVVPNGDMRRPGPLTPCGGAEVAGGVMGGVSHPPMLKPGAVTTMRYLLRGYRLLPGAYGLRASGKAGVGWQHYPDTFSGKKPVVQAHKYGDPVAGAEFETSLPFTVRSSTRAELEAVYAPLVNDARESYTEKGHEARQAIFEMAPPFLERQLVDLLRTGGHELWGAESAAKALAEINTVDSRSALREAFDRSRDLWIRAAIVHAIAETGHADNLEFLGTLLPGRSSELDDRIRRIALLGIGVVGGDAAVSALSAAPRSPNPLVMHALVTALGNTAARSAVPVVIELAPDEKGYVRNTACAALSTLTHFAWCDGSGNVSKMQARWRAWWAEHGATATIHSPAECRNLLNLPPIR
jgi:hypothetical protein